MAPNTSPPPNSTLSLQVPLVSHSLEFDYKYSSQLKNAILTIMDAQRISSLDLQGVNAIFDGLKEHIVDR